VFDYGVVPQPLPLIAGYSLLVFESDIRCGGHSGNRWRRRRRYRPEQVDSAVSVSNLMGDGDRVVVVTAFDRISDSIRRRLT
jgi:hypothetical protein